MKILVACEFSGVVRDAFEKMGHDAWSCDLLPSDKPGNHYQKDVLDVLDYGWDMMIAHPPCTYLANSGVMHLHRDNTRWQKMNDAAEFFKKLMNAPIEKICIENPIVHKYATEIIGKPYSQKINPWQFGHNIQKTTCLWLKNLPPLFPTNIVDKGKFNEFVNKKTGKVKKQPAWYMDMLVKGDVKKNELWKMRSITFQGIADAMAGQWG